MIEYCFLTLLVQEELVESQTTGLFADEAVHVLGAVVVNGYGVFQRLNTRLQTERDLGVADGVPEEEADICLHMFRQYVHFWCVIMLLTFRKGLVLKGELNCLWCGIITATNVKEVVTLELAVSNSLDTENIKPLCHH